MEIHKLGWDPAAQPVFAAQRKGDQLSGTLPFPEETTCFFSDESQLPEEKTWISQFFRDAYCLVMRVGIRVRLSYL